VRAKLAHLFSPHSGLLGQVVRFGLAGGSVAVLYVTVTTVLSQVVGFPFELALAIGFVCGLLLHFTLQRVFVWMHHEDFALDLRGQVGRYLTMAAVQYGTTAASTGLLPGALSLPTEAVYLVTMAVVTLAGFVVMRLLIFHAGATAVDPQVADIDASDSVANVPASEQVP
jgi:putative flippase GtrA